MTQVKKDVSSDNKKSKTRNFNISKIAKEITKTYYKDLVSSTKVAETNQESAANKDDQDNDDNSSYSSSNSEKNS